LWYAAPIYKRGDNNFITLRRGDNSFITLSREITLLYYIFMLVHVS
jgi:hypothetical protein